MLGFLILMLCDGNEVERGAEVRQGRIWGKGWKRAREKGSKHQGRI